MSLFSKFLPHALCCIYPRSDQNQEEPRPSTSYDPPSTVATVARKPLPYAMINVPHQPDIVDEQAFRRMLTASPACPIEAGPISNAQLQREHKKRKKPLPRCRGSLDLNYSFNPGSPLPASGPTEPRNTKQKTSKSRLDNKSLKGKGRESDAYRCSEHLEDATADPETTMLATSAQSAGLCDVLTPRNASLRGYDSDAEMITTPELREAAATIGATPERGQEAIKDADLMPYDSMSNRLLSPLPVEASNGTSTKRLTRSSPYPCTPEKISFTDALQPQPSESPSVVLKRLSVGIANGSIRPPTDLELQTLSAPISHASADDWKLSLQAPLRWSSFKKEPDSPLTVIRRLSNTVQSEEEEDKLKENSSDSKSDNKRASLVTLLEPALLEYLARFSEMQPLDLTLYNDNTTSKTTIREEDCSAFEPLTGEGNPTSSETKSQDRSSIDVTSMASVVPSEHHSVHLFNMDIPTRLESRSNATILSPAISANNSRGSLGSPPPMPTLSRNSPIRHVAPFRSGRAEHNRKPSDPQTRHIFEQPGRRYHPYWKASTTSINKSKPFQERDDASSIYSTDCGAPPSTSEVSYITSASNVRKNVNSLAIGGRSASTEIPIRRSSRTHSCSLSIPERSFATAGKGQNDQLDAAAQVIGRYLDGENGADVGKDDASPSSRVTGHEERATDSVLDVKDLGSPNEMASEAKTRRLNTGSVTPAKRLAKNGGSMNQDFSIDLAKKPATDADRADADDSILKESATDMWNRVYREARADGQVRDFLSPNDLDIDSIHRRPSYTSPRFRHRSSSILQTPTSALRRSQSADHLGGRTLRGGENDTTSGKSRLAKTMRRLSFWQLKPQRQQGSADYPDRKLPERGDQEVTKRKSFATFERDRAMDLRAAHTPPLSHYLGYWGSFPSDTRAERNGPAGKPDNVLTRNFGAEQTGEDPDGVDPVPLRSRISTGTLSLLQSTSNLLFPVRSKKLDRSKTKSKSASLGSPNHRIEKKQTFFPKRWQRQYRTKSTEWRGYVTAKGHRSSISQERPVKHPELKSLPDEGLFGKPQKRPGSDADDASFESVPRLASDSNDTDQTTKMTDAATQTFEQQERINGSSIWESVMFANMSETDQRMKENTQPLRGLSEGVDGTAKRVPGEMAATFPRTSRDLKMPGGFEEY